jgi:heme/copper-type cytochrome/quinol oxidase subunit 2
MTLKIYILAFAISWLAGTALLIGISRRRHRARSQGLKLAGMTRLLIGGSITLLVVTVALVFLIIRELDQSKTVLSNELLVEATTNQCRWFFDYLQSGVRTKEMVIPVGRPVRIDLTSLDDVHTFSVPELGFTRDARPLRWTTLTLLAKEINDYQLSIDEKCVGSEEIAPVLVRVVEPMAFQSWLAIQPTSPRSTLVVSQAERGQRIAETSGCLGCHSVDGSAVAGPTLKGLYGSQRRLEDGSMVLADDRFILTAIREPGVQLSAGYPNIMPPAFTMLSDEEIQAIIVYLASLK